MLTESYNVFIFSDSVFLILFSFLLDIPSPDPSAAKNNVSLYELLESFELLFSNTINSFGSKGIQLVGVNWN